MISSENTGFIPSPKQQQVIDYYNGEALVLAPPGCGKTDVLAYRIIKAHQDYGVPYHQMLCLTFTNRASREMQERVKSRVPGSTNGLFIGNLHRFCNRFLFENALVKLDTSIIDEDDQAEIITELGSLRGDYKQYTIGRVLNFANSMRKRQLGFPSHLVNFKNNNDYPSGSDAYLTQLYIEYKDQNHLIDYDDIINLTYYTMMNPNFKSLKLANYQWVQVDEIQDLNPLQFAIIEKLIDPAQHTVVLLGDERQAIFSFIGASLSSLKKLEQRMQIFNFDTNYRSPKYLVDFINAYAVTNLNVKAADLPIANNDVPNDGGLMLMGVSDNKEEAALVAAQARQISIFSPSDTIGILTRTNQTIDEIAKHLDSHHLEYLKLTRKDRFKMVDFKTIYSHLAVVANEHRGAEWSRLLYQTKIIDKIKDARALASKFRNLGLSFTDMMRSDNSSYLLEWANIFDHQEMVVFDTETTGLEIFEDDVIQIAAFKINANGIIPNSKFEVFIATDREIPMLLGNGTRNPMVEAHANAHKISFQEAISAFVEYIGDCPLIGHNIDFDINTILANISRRTQAQKSEFPCFANYWDSLKLARLTDPDLRSHRLDALIGFYGLDGANTHNATDDARATANLIVFLRGKMQPLLEEQQEVLKSKDISRLRLRIKGRYQSYYDHTRQRLYSPVVCAENSLITEIQWLYSNFLLDKYINSIPRFQYIIDLFSKVLVDWEKEPYFYQQLLGHVHEMRTFSESDLYHNGVVRENIHIMTIHKAKGLQFDNVFVYGVEEFPTWWNKKKCNTEEMRVLYVAISRAKKRLYLCHTGKGSPYITKEMQEMCQRLSPQQISRILQLEDVYKTL